MRIAIGADHAGFKLKVELARYLDEAGHNIVDCGTDSDQPVDYPPICADVARRVASGEAERGLVLGGSGQGEQITANKIAGIRAALCNDLYTARMARSHNDANVLAIGARVVAPALAKEILQIFIETQFEGGRHASRLEQISEIERAEAGAS